MSLFNRLFSSSRSAPAPTHAVPDGVRIYAISDIHGRSALLRKTLDWIAKHAANNPCNQVIEMLLGDYVDRGMHSREVLDLLCADPPEGHQRICLKGNHELAMLRFLKDPAFLREWMQYGGLATLDSYGLRLPAHLNEENQVKLQQEFKDVLPEAHLTFLNDLQLCAEFGDYYFVHAGVRPGVPLSEQRREDQLWIREPFLSHSKPYEKMIVHGHTPQFAPGFYSNRINLDVNEAAEEMLACLVLEGSEKQMHVIIAD